MRIPKAGYLAFGIPFSYKSPDGFGNQMALITMLIIVTTSVTVS